MSKDKHSLKKVYELALKLTKESHHADIDADFQRRILARNPASAKTLKDLYLASSEDNVINQIISTKIPGLGTFDLTPVQIGLIGCIDQYYFGDKQLALNLINVLKTGQSIEPEETNQSVRLAAGYIRENENSADTSAPNTNLLDKEKDFTFKMNIKYAKIFLEECRKKGILNDNYSIVEGYTISQNKYMISSASGFLFEMFLCFNIEDFFGENNVNKNNTAERLAFRADTTFILSILCIIYKTLTIENIDNIKKENTDNTIKKSRELYELLKINNIDIFNSLLDSELDRDKLYFDFQEGSKPLDLYVRKNNKQGNILSIIDLKTSSVGEEVYRISGSFEKTDEQIEEIFNKYYKTNNSSEYNNFFICSLNILYTYNNDGVSVEDILCNFIDFKGQYAAYKKVANKEGSKDKSFRIEKSEGNYFTLENDKIKPVSENHDIVSTDDYIMASSKRDFDDAIDYIVKKGTEEIPVSVQGKSDLKQKLKNKLNKLQDRELIQSVVSKYAGMPVEKSREAKKEMLISMMFDSFDGRYANEDEKRKENTNVILYKSERLGAEEIRRDQCINDVVKTFISKEKLNKQNARQGAYLIGDIKKKIEKHYNIDTTDITDITDIIQTAVSKYAGRDVEKSREAKKEWIISHIFKRYDGRYATEDEKSKENTNVILNKTERSSDEDQNAELTNKIINDLMDVYSNDSYNIIVLYKRLNRANKKYNVSDKSFKDCLVSAIGHFYQENSAAKDKTSRKLEIINYIINVRYPEIEVVINPNIVDAVRKWEVLSYLESEESKPMSSAKSAEKNAERTIKKNVNKKSRGDKKILQSSFKEYFRTNVIDSKKRKFIRKMYNKYFNNKNKVNIDNPSLNKQNVNIPGDIIQEKTVKVNLLRKVYKHLF